MSDSILPPSNDPLTEAVRSVYRRQKQEEHRTLLDVYESAATADPNVEAEFDKMSKTLGVPRDNLPVDIEKVRAEAKRRETAKWLFELNNPGLRDRFKDVKLMKLAHDDLGNIVAANGIFDWWERNYEAGSTINEAGFLKAKRAFLRQSGGALTPFEEDRLTEIDNIQQAAEQETGFFDEAVKLVGQFVAPLARAVTTGGLVAGGTSLAFPPAAGPAFTVGTVSAMFAQSAVTEFGHEYDTIYQQLVDSGVPPDEAHDTALLTASAYGLGAAAADTLGFSAAAAPLKRAAGKMVGGRLLGLARPTAARATGTFLKETGTAFAGEVGTEGVQEGLAALAENVAGLMQNKDSGPSLEETLGRIGEVMLRTAKGMAVLSPIGPAIHYAADLSRVKEAQGAQELFTRMAEVAAESELKKRSPETFAQVVDARVEGSNLEAVYIEAPALIEGLRRANQSREQLANDLPEVAKQLAAAERDGGEVRIPMGDFAAKIADTDLYPAIQKALYLKNGFSIERAEEWLAEQKQNREESAKLIAEAAAKNIGWNAEAEKVEARILGEIAKDTRIPQAQAKQYAALHRQFVETQAAREGKTPAQFDEEHRLTFQVNRNPETSSRPQKTNDRRISLRSVGSGDGSQAAAAPRYGVSRQGSHSVLGLHFSREARSTLSGAYYGTGLPGAERRRVAGDPVVGQRIHFYVDTGSGIEPERGVGDVGHLTHLDNVYNTDEDPLGLVKNWSTPDFSDLERAIVAAGFDGIYVPRAQGTQGVAVLLGPQHAAVPTTQFQEEQQTYGQQDTGSDEAPAGAVQDGGRVRGGTEPVDEQAGPQPDAPPLQGLPGTVTVDGREVVFGPSAVARRAAADYARKAGIFYSPPTAFAPLDEARAKRIAAAYEAMQHAPNDPEVKAAYEALAQETVAQYEAMLATGVRVEFNPPSGDPYPQPRYALLDLEQNNHLFVFSTEDGYGQVGISEKERAENPMLRDSGFKFGDRPALINDLFRAVHDYFGHFKEGVGFRARGEENAWQQHMAMFSPLARKAITTETRGQNSWVNFGPHAEANKTASGAATVYAEQKIGLLPPWAMEEGYLGDRPQRFAQPTDAGIYSALRRLTDAMPDNVRLDVKGWQEQFQKWVDAGLVKQQELFWSGIEEGLKTAAASYSSKPFLLFRDDQFVRRVSAEEARRLREENPDVELEEETATAQVSAAEMKSFLKRGEVITTTATRKELLENADQAFYVFGEDSQELAGPFDTEDKAYQAQSELVDEEVERLMEGEFTIEEDVDSVEDDRTLAAQEDLLDFEDWKVEAFGSDRDTLEDKKERIWPDAVENGYLDVSLRAVANPVFPRLDEHHTREFLHEGGLIEQLLADEAQQRSYYDRYVLLHNQLNAAHEKMLEDSYRIDVSNLHWTRRQIGRTLDRESLSGLSYKEAVRTVERLRQALRDALAEDVNYYVDRKAPEIEEDRFGSYTVNNAGEDPSNAASYEQVAIVLDPESKLVANGNTRYEAPDSHTFGGELTDKNRLAHYRTTRRTLELPGEAPEETALFVEEIQSDYADDFREFGTDKKPYAEQRKLWRKMEDANDELNRHIRNVRVEAKRAAEASGVLSGARPAADDSELRRFITPEQIDEAKRLFQKIRDARRAYEDATEAVTPSPFVHTTDAWVSLAVKHILTREVARTRPGNRAAIALVNGEQNAAFYTLDTVVKSLVWETDKLLGIDKKIRLVPDHGREHIFTVRDGVVVSSTLEGSEDKRLEDVIGKELAEKIAKEDVGDLDAESLALGGEGMRTFYGDADGHQTNMDDRKLLNEKGQPKPAVVPRIFREVLAKVPGVTFTRGRIVSNTGGYDNLLIQLSPEAVEFIRNQGFPLFQENRGEFDPATNEIFLNPQANATTVLHEMSHFWLSTLFKVAASPQASLQSRVDAQKVLDWFGVKDLTAWGALTFEEQRKHHEAWAYNAEAHFFGEGVAPSIDEDQKRLFRTFGRWVRSVYRFVRDKLNATYKRQFGVELPGLNDDVRAVFDRMLASEDAIAAAKAERAAAPLFTEKPEGVDDAEWNDYQNALRDSDDEALWQLQTESLRTMRWLGNNEAKLAKKLQRHTRVLRKRVEAEERKKLEAEPVYRAIDTLRHGVTDDNGVSRPFKISLSDFRGTPYGDEERVKLFGTGPSGMLAVDGLPIETVANLLGFETGEDLVLKIIQAPPIDEAVKQRADARMVAEHSDLMDPEKVRLLIERALHGEARLKLVAAELRWLAKLNTPARTMVRAAREHARNVIGRKRIGDVKPHEHAQAETRNRREAMRAMAKGEHEKAASLKRRELLEAQMEREAIAVREEIEAARKVVKALFKPDPKLAKRRDVDYVAVGRYLAAAFGMAPGEKSADSYIEQLRNYNPELFEKLEPMIERAKLWAANALAEGREVKTWRDLTVDEFRDLREMLDALWSRSLRERQFVVAGKRLELDTVAAEVAAQNEKLPKPKELTPGARTAFESLGEGFNHLKQLAYRPEHWAYRKDGASTGAFTRYVWRPVRAAVDAFVTDRNRYTKRVSALVKKLRPSLKQGLIDFRDANGKLLYTFGRGNGGLGHAELVAALLHVGNRGNLERLLVGRGWGTYHADADVLDTAQWDAFVLRMVNEGYITKDVMDFVQSVWDLNEEIKPLAQRAHKDLFGFYFDEIEAAPVVLPFGTYRGGYMPAKLDKSAPSAGRIQKLQDLEKDFRQQFATTGRGFTKNRAKHFAEPLLLDINLVPSHIDEVLRFSHLQPVIRDVEKLLKHSDVAPEIEASQPGVWQNMLLPWLQRVASQSVTKAGKSAEVDSFWRAVRSSAGLSTMFANIGNALQQFTGAIVATLKVKPRFLFHGLGQFLSKRRSLYKEIAELSPFMANRQTHQTFEALEEIDDLISNRSKFAKARAWVRKHGYFLQSSFQNVVDSVVWTGAYKQALDTAKKTLSDEDARADAVKAADAAVRMTQSSFEPTDVAGYEEGTPFYRVWTMFSGYFNTMANLQADGLVAVGRRTGFARAGSAFQLYLLAFALPMLLADAITRTVRGQWDDEDDDGEVDVLTFDYLFLGQLRSAIAQIPVAGPSLIAPTFNMLDNQPWNDRMTTSPAVSLLERAVGGTVKSVKTAVGLRVDRKGNPVDLTGENIRDPLTLLGLMFGLPGAAVGSRLGYAYDLAQGTIEPSGAVDTARGLISGAAGRQAGQ